MGYLGLDETPVKDDNMFQRLFWPSDHAGETDSLGKQGFWVCFSIGIFSMLGAMMRGHPFLGLLTGLFYVLGGMGVREHNQPAATLVALAYLLNVLAAIFSGRFPGFISLAAAVLLIANIRGTYIAAKWAASGDADAMPERMNASIADKLEDQWPGRIWPKGQIAFFVIAGVYLLLTVLGVVMLAVRPAVKQKPEPPSTVLHVSPTR